MLHQRDLFVRPEELYLLARGLFPSKRDLSKKTKGLGFQLQGLCKPLYVPWQVSRTSRADKTIMAGFSVFCDDEK